MKHAPARHVLAVDNRICLSSKQRWWRRACRKERRVGSEKNQFVPTWYPLTIVWPKFRETTPSGLATKSHPLSFLMGRGKRVRLLSVTGWSYRRLMSLSCWLSTNRPLNSPEPCSVPRVLTPAYLSLAEAYYERHYELTSFWSR